ncbi:hypothetical protein BC829DRAFT_421407 [Chytridium lagenaria]|nr:hypothetical protein BC829DRAFT_421407 [Chytridium lagenaria]
MTFLRLPPDIWRRIALYLAYDEKETSHSGLLHVANASKESKSIFTSPPFSRVWQVALRQRWPWVAAQRAALGYANSNQRSEGGDADVDFYAMLLLIQCGLKCPVCRESCVEEIGDESNDLFCRACEHAEGSEVEDCQGCKARVAARLKKRILESFWLQCPCCDYSRSKRKNQTSRRKAWTCESLLDQVEERFFCSRLCGDAIAQIECEADGCDHGCAACFKDGNIIRVEEGTVDGVSKYWLCKENDDDSLADDDDDEDDDDDDLAAMGLEGCLVEGLIGTSSTPNRRRPDENKWWEKKAKRCRELGSMFGECVCGECDIYNGGLDEEIIPNSEGF